MDILFIVPTKTNLEEK